jgi:hypothetical protein
VIIQLTNPTLTDDLSSFLMRCPCTVRRVGPAGLLVEVARGEDDRGRGGVPRCYSCGEELEPPLGRLGSLRCLDCRGRADDGNRRIELLRLAALRESGDTQIRAFVRVWQALHPEAEDKLRLVA